MLKLLPLLFLAIPALSQDLLRLPGESGIGGSFKAFEYNYQNFSSIGLQAGAESRDLGEGNFLRTDRVRLTATLSPGMRVLNAIGEWTPIGLKMEAGQEIQVSRIFPSRAASLSAMPLPPGMLPWDAASALRLPVGTIVAFPLTMGFGIGAGLTHLHYPVITQARTGVLWSGQMSLVVIRGSENRFLVRLMPRQSLSWDSFVSSELHFLLFTFDANRILHLERNAERLLGTDVLRATLSKQIAASASTLDIGFDLAQQEARGLFDQLLQRGVKVNVQAIADQLRVNQDSLSKELLDLTGVAAYLESHDDSNACVGVDFSGHDHFNGTTKNWHLGFKLLRWGEINTIHNHDVSLETKGGTQKYRVLDFFDRKQVSTIFSKLREREDFRAYGVVDQGDHGQVGRGIKIAWKMDSEMNGDALQNHLSRMHFILGDFVERSPAQTKAHRVKTEYEMFVPPQTVAAMNDFWRDPMGEKRFALKVYNETMQNRPNSNIFSAVQPLLTSSANFVERFKYVGIALESASKYRLLLTPLAESTDAQDFYISFLRRWMEYHALPFVLHAKTSMNGEEKKYASPDAYPLERKLIEERYLSLSRVISPILVPNRSKE